MFGDGYGSTATTHAVGGRKSAGFSDVHKFGPGAGSPRLTRGWLLQVREATSDHTILQDAAEPTNLKVGPTMLRLA